jgi:hypothetical protein
MRPYVPIIAALFALPGSGCAPDPPGATVEDAVVTLPAVRGSPGAAYFTIRTNRPARLTGVSSPAIGRIELHESMATGGMNAMGPLRDTGVSPGAPMLFEPGGRHAMLFDIAPSVRVGQSLTMTFAFDRLPPVSIEAEVRAPGGVSRAP